MFKSLRLVALIWFVLGLIISWPLKNTQAFYVCIIISQVYNAAAVLNGEYKKEN